MTPQASDKESKQQMLKKPKHPDGFQEGILKGKCWGGMDSSMPSFPVLYYLLEFVQIPVH